MGQPASQRNAEVERLLELYPVALPEVYGYIVRRVGSRALAEDLTGEVFFAALSSAQQGRGRVISVGWLIGIARHKIVDSWRQQERDQRRLHALSGELQTAVDDWHPSLDENRSLTVLRALPPQYRSALSLRYLDGLPVADVAEQLDKTIHATESVLMRAKAAFRTAYEVHDEGASGV